MRSFQLNIEPRTNLIRAAIGLAAGGGAVVAGLYYFQVVHSGLRIVTMILGACLVAGLCRGQLCRGLRTKYPNARWVGLLAVGFSLTTLGVALRMTLPGADDASLTLAWLLPAGACIGIFVLINRRDPDVMA